MDEPPIDPTSTGALYELAVEWDRRGDVVNALRYYAETLRLDPEEARARRGIGACLARLGRTEAGIDILRIAAESFGRRGLWLSSIAACAEALAIDPEHAEVQEMLGALHDAFSRRRRRHPRPPRPPQPVTKSAKDSVVLVAERDEVITRAIEIGRSYVEEQQQGGPEPPLFAEISRAALLALAPRISLQKVEWRATLRAPSSLLIVVNGRLRSERGNLYSPGSVIGYRSLIAEQDDPEELRAEAPTELLEIEKSDLEEIARQHESFAAEIADFVKGQMLRALLASPMLEGLPAEARVEILGSFSSSIVAEGTAIVQEGARASGLYLIGSGQVQITRDTGDDTSEIAAVLGPGEVFGEIALLDHRPATATAIAVQKTVLFHLDRARFVGLTARHKELRNYLVELAKSRLSQIRR